MMDWQYVRSVSLKKDEVPSFRSYPFNLPSFRALNELALHPKVTFMIGENGMGKSTLLEAIAVALGFNPEGGSFNFNFSTFDSHSNLGNYLRIVKGVERPKECYYSDETQRLPQGEIILFLAAEVCV